jgi:hypothetical protein
MISKDKTYTTLRGMPVRIYATDAGGLFPVHGAIFNDGIWNGMKWTEEGKTHFTTTSCMVNTVDDLAEVKPRIKRTVWLNLFPDHTEIFPTEEIAKHCAAMPSRFEHEQPISCVKVEIDCEEGEGL